jgi:hypothetical protein
MEQALVSNQPTMKAYILVNASNVFGWMDLLAMRDIPLNGL